MESVTTTMAGEGIGNDIHRILVVDDEPQVVWVLQLALDAEGYEVLTAHNGIEALAQVSEGHPELMVLDVMMPRMDGWSVMRELAKQEKRLGATAIVVSSDVNYGILRMMETLLQDVTQLRPFRDFHAAEAWVSQQKS